MPVVLPIIAGVALATAVVGTVATIGAQNKANKLAKQQFTYEKQLNQNRSVRERRDAIRAARISGGTLLQQSNNTGGSASSAALGGMGSIQSQLDSNLSFLDTQTSLASKSTAAGEAAREANATAQNWSGVTQLGFAVFNATGGFGGGGKK